jgi:IS30 family transposase
LIHTITGDNREEFTDRARIAKTLKANFYFAHPYSAWEHGINKNTNGLIRQYFPKRTDFSKITLTEAKVAVDGLNHRPRKCLDFKTPFTMLRRGNARSQYSPSPTH